MSKWDTVRLGDIFVKKISGEWGSHCEDNEEGVSVLRTTNFTNEGIINYSKIAYRIISQEKVQKKRLQYGDILLEKSGGSDNVPVGRVVFCDEDIENAVYLNNNFTMALRADDKHFYSKYVFYAMYRLHLTGKTHLLQSKTTGIRNLQTTEYLNHLIPAPPLEMQQTIAKELDTLTLLIEKRKAQLEKLDLLIKSKFIEMFGDPVSNPMGWNVVTMSSIITLIESGWSVNGELREKTPNEMAVLKISSVTTGIFDPNEYKVITSKNIKKKISPNKGDLLFSRANTRELVGATCIVDKDYNDLILPDKLWKIHNSQNNVFIKFALSSPYVRNQIVALATGTSGSMFNISMKKLKDIQIHLPPIELQNQFADFVLKVEQVKENMKNGLEKIELLYHSRMQEYFG